MEKVLFHELYKRLDVLEIRSCPPGMLSCLLRGYLSVYSMVQVYPWLERDFGTPNEVHERAKNIARLYSELLTNADLPVDSRAGYAAGLMDVYRLYSDLSYLTDGLEAAYALLTSSGGERVVLPCRTSNVCRLLCDCYYFAGDKACGELAGRLVTEELGYIRGGNLEFLLDWWGVFCLYRDVAGADVLPVGEREWLGEELNRLRVSVKRVEDEMIDRFRHSGHEADFSLVSRVFEILAEREFEGRNEGGKGGLALNFNIYNTKIIFMLY